MGDAEGIPAGRFHVMMMLGLDGYQFREHQKRDQAIRNIPVVVVSVADIDSSLDASGHIYKPFLPEELLQTIRRCS